MISLLLSPTLATDLEQVESIIRERTRSRSAVINIAGQHLLQPGRLHLHAALVLLTAYAYEYKSDQVIHAAAAVELISAATRTHDDLVDEAERRRGTTPAGEWNHGVALMVGDYLFALASGEMALSPDPRVIAFYSHAVMEICEAQLAPVTVLSPLEQAREHYFARTSGAIATLYAAACRAGAICGGAGTEQIEALGQFGHSLGLAFQLGTEIADFSTSNQPPAGTSVHRSSVSLPLILAAAHGDGQRLATALDSADPAEHDWAVEEVRRYGLEPARAELLALLDQAQTALESVPAGEARTALTTIVNDIVRQAT